MILISFIFIMQATLHDPDISLDCAPLTNGRGLGDCLVANHKLSELMSNELQQAGFEVVPNSKANAQTVHLPVDHWIEVGALCMLAKSDTAVCLVDKRGDLVAWKGVEKPKRCGNDIITEASCFRIKYPWDLLQLNEEVLSMLDNSEISGDIHPLAYVDGHIHLGRGSKILPGVYIEGNVIIGEDCQIGPNAYIHGNTSIGDHCRIGNAVEIVNSVIYPHTHVRHLSFVGDSILGSHVQLGVGTVAANYRHDGTNHRSLVQGKLIDTQRERFGAIIGDGVRTGINTCIYPGRKIGPGRMTNPNATVEKDLMSSRTTGGGSTSFQI